jgi:hypothetical protein
LCAEKANKDIFKKKHLKKCFIQKWGCLGEKLGQSLCLVDFGSKNCAKEKKIALAAKLCPI